MINFLQVGKKITTLRKQNGMSQEELANLLFVTRQCLSKWELGSSAPSVDVILELSRIFGVSIDEILCLDDEGEIDESNIFKGHERMHIIKRLINNELDVKLHEVFYQLSSKERMLVLRNIKLGVTRADIDELYIKLTESEKRYLGGKHE